MESRAPHATQDIKPLKDELTNLLSDLSEQARKLKVPIDSSLIDYLINNLTKILGNTQSQYVFAGFLFEIRQRGLSKEGVQQLIQLLQLFASYGPVEVSQVGTTGYTKISNPLIHVFMRLRLSSQEWRITWVILMKTVGWNKEMDWISISQFIKLTGMSKSNCLRAIKKLVSKKIILKDDLKYPIRYGLNPGIDEWRGVSKQRPSLFGDRLYLENKGSLNRDIQKTYYKKKIPSLFLEDSEEMKLAVSLLGEIQKNKPDFKRPNIQSWAKDIDLMLRRDRRIPDRVREVIGWVQGDSFWKANILSPGSLRKQFDRLELAMQKTSIQGSDRTTQYQDLTGRGSA